MSDENIGRSGIEIAAFLGFVAVGAFICSLLYVDGLSRYLQYDLKPYLTIQGFVQITACSALNAFIAAVVGTVIGFFIMGFVEPNTARIVKPKSNLWDWLKDPDIWTNLFWSALIVRAVFRIPVFGIPANQHNRYFSLLLYPPLFMLHPASWFLKKQRRWKFGSNMRWAIYYLPYILTVAFCGL